MSTIGHARKYGTHFDKNIPVTVFIEDVGVKYLELGDFATAMLVLTNDILVRIGLLRVLVQKLHVGVSRRRIKVVVEFLDIFSMIALRPGDAEEPFFKHSILLIPQGKRKTKTLMVVANACNAIFSPSVSPRASVLMGEVCPSIAVPRVVFPYGCLEGLLTQGLGSDRDKQ
jgi:hypothetical protein